MRYGDGRTSCYCAGVGRRIKAPVHSATVLAAFCTWDWRWSSPDTTLLLDFVGAEEIEEGVTSNIAELGLRTMINPLTILGVGVGFGLDDESPDLRVMVGLQRAF